MEHLKEILFNLFDCYTEYEDIINSLRSLESVKEISTQEYDMILLNYDKWLLEYNKEENHGN